MLTEISFKISFWRRPPGWLNGTDTANRTILTNASVKSSIEGVKAWSLKRLGSRDQLDLALYSVEAAVQLDESNPHGHAIKAAILDTPRYVKGGWSEPNEDVIAQMRKACELSDWSLAYYVVLYAHLL